jgi:NADH-quinone oxidoreductase subunit G
VLPYNSLLELRARLAAQYPVFSEVASLRRLAGTEVIAPGGDASALGAEAFGNVFPNYYQTDPISRASPTMAACVAAHGPRWAEVAE